MITKGLGREKVTASLTRLGGGGKRREWAGDGVGQQRENPGWRRKEIMHEEREKRRNRER